MIKKTAIFFLLLVSIRLWGQFNYGHQMEFGKNRIQYKEFVWNFYDYEDFRVYYYQGGQEIAKYVAYSTSRQLPIINKRIGRQTKDKINVLVYNNISDFRQSNIGLNNDEQGNTGGTTKIIGDKVFLYFNGSRAELEQQVRAGLAEVLINKELFEGSAREMVRNSTLLNVPDWFSQGLVRYLSQGWTTLNDNQLYDNLKNDQFSSFNRLSGEKAAQAGHALWYYLASTFGESYIPTLLYMTRVTRSPENALINTLGITLPGLINDLTEVYHRRIYGYRDSLRKSPIQNNTVLKRFSENSEYYHPSINSNGQLIAYATNQLNQLRVYVKNTENGSVKRIVKLGPKVEMLPDYNYPLLAWHPDGKHLLIVFEKADQIYLQTSDLESNEKIIRPLPGFTRINSMHLSPDGKKLLMSAVKRGKGQSDIFIFGLSSGAIEQLTNDCWDDQHPVFVKNAKQIVFESNRLSDTLKSDDGGFFNRFNRNMDLLMMNYPVTSKALVRVVRTPDIDEKCPQPLGRDKICYLTDKNGIYNRVIAEFDSTIAFVDTTEHYRYFFKSQPVSNTDRTILSQYISENGEFYTDHINANGRDLLLYGKLNTKPCSEPMNSWYRGFVSPAITNPDDYRDSQTSEQVTPKKQDGPSKGIDFDNYILEGEKAPESTTKRGDSTKVTKGKNPFGFPIPRNYFTSFYTDYVVTQFDNSFLANNYQVFAGGGNPIYLNPGFNLLTRVAVSDLFEDQRIVGGFRFNPGLDNEFMLSWEQRKRMWDHSVVFDRQTFSKTTGVVGNGDLLTKLTTHSVRYTIKKPFSIVSSLRLSALYRNDRKVTLSEGDFTLRRGVMFDNLVGLRAEYVYDNTRKVMLNVLNGFRFKVWTEAWTYTSSGAQNLFTSGFDARHYLKVHRQITWCNRFAGGTSQGSKKLIFYLGGVDNWLAPTFNNNVNIVRANEYGFQTLATNMRGFNQNIRNGNNFLVYNSELRIPVVRYFMDHPVRSEFFNNFQVIGFADLGMAWYGINPLSAENTENVKAYIDSDPQLGKGSTGIIVTVIDRKNPLVGGVGFGMRSKLLGYFVRLDFGWGIDNMNVAQKVVALSVCTDF